MASQWLHLPSLRGGRSPTKQSHYHTASHCEEGVARRSNRRFGFFPFRVLGAVSKRYPRPFEKCHPESSPRFVILSRPCEGSHLYVFFAILGFLWKALKGYPLIPVLIRGVLKGDPLTHPNKKRQDVNVCHTLPKLYLTSTLPLPVLISCMQ